MDVSIVIVCMNRMDNLYPCLESLRRYTDKSLEYETFVVAYLFDRANLARAVKDFPWVKFIESNEIRGFAENNNLALRQACGHYCFVLNDDTELHEDVISKLVHDFETLPQDAAIVCPTLLNADGSLQLCGRPEFQAYKYLLQQFHLYSEPIDSAYGKGLSETRSISGAAFLIKTDVFRKLGWFDERYFFTPEDMALARLARVEGYTVWADSEASLIHKWRTTASRIMSATRPAAVRGSLIYFSEWRRPCRPFEAEGLALRRGWNHRLRYFLLASGVLIAEMAKNLKASLVYLFDKSEQNRIKLLTFRHITTSIFTAKTPKEIFSKYYSELRNTR